MGFLVEIGGFLDRGCMWGFVGRSNGWVLAWFELMLSSVGDLVDLLLCSSLFFFFSFEKNINWVLGG